MFGVKTGLLYVYIGELFIDGQTGLVEVFFVFRRNHTRYLRDLSIIILRGFQADKESEIQHHM